MKKSAPSGCATPSFRWTCSSSARTRRSSGSSRRQFRKRSPRGRWVCLRSTFSRSPEAGRPNPGSNRAARWKSKRAKPRTVHRKGLRRGDGARAEVRRARVPDALAGVRPGAADRAEGLLIEKQRSTRKLLVRVLVFVGIGRGAAIRDVRHARSRAVASGGGVGNARPRNRRVSNADQVFAFGGPE